ncbi:S8 family serine peptidase [Cohnella suwonensis]|uniref:S8 family serine peptidase n=1 Tax=Cohnella suwonensis TaxID=696072 RepID=A0ABW0LV02_9BACL
MRVKIVLLAAIAAMPVYAHSEAPNRTGASLVLSKASGVIASSVVRAQETEFLAPAKSSDQAAFLQEIGIGEAWPLLRNDVTATIAIVDTGADYNHPDLKPYLAEGINLVDAGKSAQDDNGHGTAVSGVVAAIARAGETSSGSARWKGRILPIKALDGDGSGDEEKLTKGIRYAVDQKANVIVLSLGLMRDALSLREAVAYAESKGVLLIAASGNDAALFGPKAAVQYPAAYPTVLSVAGAEGGLPVAASTSGTENDISGAWRVRTAALGGGSLDMEGTSMAAPQAAAVAAMLLAEHPDWKPVRVRETLRGTAWRAADDEWNPDLGYGVLSAPGALRAGDDILNWREPNDTLGTAKPLPLGKEAAGTWSGIGDADWYSFELPYAGVFGTRSSQARLLLFGPDGLVEPRSATNLQGGLDKQWTAAPGRYWLQALKPVGPSAESEYRLETRFVMNPDASEPNDSSAAARTLPARSQKWTGSFHKRGDADWFTVTLPKPGMLKLTLTTDTTRIDPGMWIQPAGGKPILVDDRGHGSNEQWQSAEAKAGKYYFRITNAVSSNPEAVIGTYAASLEYITEKEDLYEPNEAPLTSTPMSPDKVYNGLISVAKDQDWYRFSLTKKQTVDLSAVTIPERMLLNVELRNKKLQTLMKWSNADGKRSLTGRVELPPGAYYVKVTADRYSRSQYYGLKLQFAAKTK